MEWLSDAESQRLSISYEDWEDPSHARRRILAALTQPLPATFAIADLLRSELRESQGIPWLRQSNDDRAYLIVSDYAVAAAVAVEISLLDAVMAYRRYQHLRDSTVGEQLQRRYDAADGDLELTPGDELGVVESEREWAGFFVAVGSALDRLMVPVAALCALPIKLRRLTWNAGYKRATESPPLNAASAQALALIDLSEAVESSGPPGWLDWALAMRNTVVHRPRRLTISLSPNQVWAPKDPDKTDIEVGRDARDLFGVLLTETANQTIAGILTSTAALVETLSARLSKLACLRISGDLVLTQPINRQWPDDGVASGFAGYAPGTHDLHEVLDGRPLMMHPNMGRRFRAAGVMDDQREQTWQGDAT